MTYPERRLPHGLLTLLRARCAVAFTVWVAASVAALLACTSDPGNDARASRVPGTPAIGPTAFADVPTARAVQTAALRELFTVRERAQQLVFWRDATHRGPVFSRLHFASATDVPVPSVPDAATGEVLPVDSVSLQSLEQLFRDAPDGWEAFFAQHPGAPGVVELGPVRYDSGAQRAELIVGRTCGERCAMAWRVALRAQSVPDTRWTVTAIELLSLPPESPHVRFGAATTLRDAALSDFTILDARGRWAYGRGHLPGALRTDWKDYRDGWGRTGRLPTDLDQLAGELAALGVDASRPVLVYGAAAEGWGEEGRIAWILRYLGHPEVVLLDGGFAAWQRAGGAVSRASANPVPGRFAASPLPELRASGDEVAAAGPGRAVVLDTRSLDEWNGSHRYLPERTGHIPGAVHLHWRDLLTREGLLDRSPAARARLAELGLTDSTTVLAYCVGGVRSAFVTLALRELGLGDVRNYDGSWYEWSANPDRRIASPAAAP